MADERLTDGEIVTMASPKERKIRLFRAMFSGRADVYARRWVGREGKPGYSPVCSAEWVRGVCDKKRVACAVCPNRRFAPLDDAAIEAHLRGQDAKGRDCVLGVYPLLPDDTVRFAAIDFDKRSWRTDTASVGRVLHELGLPVVRERSRSGNGAHLWFFFAENESARVVREVLTFALTLAMERNPEIGLDSYDRIFPNQDRLPKGGFGNLIALPLQGQSRRAGNGCFVDDRLVPVADPWKFLSEVELIGDDKVKRLWARAQSANRRLNPQRDADIERGEPWSLFLPGILPESVSGDPPSEERISGRVQITLANAVSIRQNELTPSVRGKLVRLASFANPVYADMQRMRLNVFNTPRIIDCSTNGDDFLILPRGCLENALATLKAEGASWDLVDKRQSGTPLDVAFHGELREEQRMAAHEMLKRDTGVLAAGTAFGKTVLAAWLIAERKVSTLVLVNRRPLQQQWIERLAQFLDLPKKAIGRIGGGAHKPTGRIDVALIQTLTRLEGEFLANAVGGYGQIVVDECHAVSAPSFEKVARAASAKYFLGLSATVVRKDGHHPIIEMQCGPVRHRVEARQMDGFAQFRHVVRVRPTPFVPKTTTVEDEGLVAFADLVAELAANDARNRLIADDVLAAVREGRSPVVISERREHLDALAEMLKGKVQHMIVLRGGMGARRQRELRAELAAIPSDESRLLLATGSFLGEGFDDARLDTLFLTLPISWRGRVTQYAGRLHRQCDGKREVRIYDYVDLRAAMCAKMFNKRCLGYKAIGYEIVYADDPLSGWPKDVELPVALKEDKTFADALRRLTREGVDSETADLFVAAALARGDVRETDAGSAPARDRARSAAERFLFRYLDVLPDTKGRFELNARLPIPFGPNPFLEVDLLCSTGRIVVEIDGAFHFADAEHYRRDRRKDYLLQDAGYLVLRFLAEDVTAKLDSVLDVVRRALKRKNMKNIITLSLALVLVMCAHVGLSDVRALCSDWEFRRGDETAWTRVSVPHDWAIAGPFHETNDLQIARIAQDGETVEHRHTGRTGALPWPGKGRYRRRGARFTGSTEI